MIHVLSQLRTGEKILVPRICRPDKQEPLQNSALGSFIYSCSGELHIKLLMIKEINFSVTIIFSTNQW